MLPQSREKSDRSEVIQEFRQVQQILTDDARLLPLWQSKLYVAASEEISGCETGFDASSIMMVWQLGRKTSW